MRYLGRRLRSLLFKLLGAYVVYAIAMILLHPGFIYPFDQRGFEGEGYREVLVEVPGADPLPVQVAQGQSGAPVILYFMGNLGALELFRPMLDHHKDQGRWVVAMPYRGAGGVPGEPSEQGMKRDALAVFDALDEIVTEGAVVVQGYSMGTGLAMYVAAERPVDGVILSAPFDRLCGLMAKRALLPACYLPFVQKWDSLADAGDVDAPVLVLHGDRDELIDIARGRRLAEALAGSTEVAFQVIPGAGHSNLFGADGYLPTIDAFIEGL